MATPSETFPSRADSNEYDYDFPDFPKHEERERVNSASMQRKRLPIPDLRFEQIYLSRIRSCLHIEPRSSSSKEKEKEHDPVIDLASPENQAKAVYAAATHASPLVDSSQEITRIEWGNVAWITVRDQVIMPLLQGMVWGVVSQYYRPFLSFAGDRIRGKMAVKKAPVEGGAVSWLRSCVKKLGLSDLTAGNASRN
ncbi:hypothetical protein BJ138DRAFT_1157800 [Hygrophoropsis aurantiaca]|uniref:Uncharacterized protein n=1 Tax=Hygrophoropsis aurantiaca TaxID=72124 RepID=A0ACB8A4E9_9AGAM|nr:hypothetical protein BJ138DRAFT_1157800 [Hygrophoropsis aurantiaca]